MLILQYYSILIGSRVWVACCDMTCAIIQLTSMHYIMMYILCIGVQASCDNLRAEKQLISQAEARATQLYQSLMKEQQNQNLVLVNLQTIQVL